MSLATLYGWTPFLMAAYRLDAQRVKELLDEDPTVILDRDKSGRTALHLAIEDQSYNGPKMVEVVKLLLEHRAPPIDINAVTRKYHESALQYAVYYRLDKYIKEVIKMLVAAGINTNITGGVQPETTEWANEYIEKYYAPEGVYEYITAKKWREGRALQGGKRSRSRRKRKIGTRRLKRKSTWK